MSSASRSGSPLIPPPDGEPFEAQVVRWLEANPSFFDTHADLLAEVRLRHPHGGSAVSLVERQVAVLREKNRAMESRMAELIRIGQQNDAIGDRLQQLTLDLLQLEDPGRLPALLEDSLRSLFGVPQVALRVWHSVDPALAASAPVDAEIRRRCDAMEGVYCGPKGDHAAVRWLPDGGARTGSIALMALRPPSADRALTILRGQRPARAPSFGLLILGSPDAGRFQVGLGTAFLERLADLAGAALSRSGRERLAA